MEEKLKKCRNVIDDIDSKILKLLLERKNQVIKIGEVKRENGLDIFDPERERKKIEKLNMELQEIYKDSLSDKDNNEKIKRYIENIFFSIIDESKKMQEK